MSNKLNKKGVLKTTTILSGYAAQILLRHKYAKVHSVFSNGFNLDYKGSLIYVSYHQKGKLSASGMTIDRKVYDHLHPQLKVGQLVRYQNERFTFYIQANSLTMTIKEWVIKELKVHNQAIETEQWLQLKDHLSAINLLESSGFSTRAILMDSYQEIHENNRVTEKHVRNLIGAGIGLTPTGDDFLQGLILIEKMLGHETIIEDKVKRQLQKRSTTDVSISYYNTLFEGYYNEPLAQLFEAMSQKDEQAMNQAIWLVQDYGETSGFDLLTGMLTYLQITKIG